MNRGRRTGRIRIVERVGPKLVDILSNRNPWKNQWCQREGCLPCQTKPGTCRSKNLVYRLKCLECKKNGVNTHYIGESSRTFWDRSREHDQALKSKNTKYAVVKHWQMDHGDQDDPPKFSYNLVGTYRTAIERQIMEAIAIEDETCDQILNGKGEWGTNHLPRLKLTINNEVIQTQEEVGAPQLQVRAPPPPPPRGQERQAELRQDEADEDNFKNQYTQRKKKLRLANPSLSPACTESKNQPSMPRDISEGQTRDKPNLLQRRTPKVKGLLDTMCSNDQTQKKPTKERGTPCRKRKDQNR